MSVLIGTMFERVEDVSGDRVDGSLIPSLANKLRKRLERFIDEMRFKMFVPIARRWPILKQVAIRNLTVHRKVESQSDATQHFADL